MRCRAAMAGMADPGVTDPDMAPPVIVEKNQAPWGFWSTLGLSIVVVLVYFLISVLIVIAFGVAFLADNPGAGIGEFTAAVATDGFVSFLGVSLAAPLCAGLVLLFIRLKASLPAREYLCLVPVGAKTVLLWLGALALLLAGSDILTYFLDRPIVPDIMVELYRTSRFAALAWFAIIIAAPVFEEVLFRGFMFRGIQASALGNGGAILITAAIWAAIHIQYDGYLIATIFVLGILFGAARAVTGSLYPTIALHVAANLVATIEMHLFAAG